MPTKRFSIARRFLTLWLALTLAWPNSALALRPRAGGLEEQTRTTDQLMDELVPAAAAGLEERPNVNRADQAAIERALAAVGSLGGRANRQVRKAVAEIIVTRRPRWLGYVSGTHFLAQMKGGWPSGLQVVQQAAIAEIFRYGVTRRRFGIMTGLGLGGISAAVGSGFYAASVAVSRSEVEWWLIPHDRYGRDVFLRRLRTLASRPRLMVVLEDAAADLSIWEMSVLAVAPHLTIANVDRLIAFLEQNRLAELKQDSLGRMVDAAFTIMRRDRSPAVELAKLRADPSRLEDPKMRARLQAGDWEPTFRYLVQHPGIPVAFEEPTLLSCLYTLRSQLSERLAFRLFVQEGVTAAYDQAMADHFQFNTKHQEARDRPFSVLMAGLLRNPQHAGTSFLVQRGNGHYRVVEYTESIVGPDYRFRKISSSSGADDNYYAEHLRPAPWVLPAPLRSSAHRHTLVTGLCSLLSPQMAMPYEMLLTEVSRIAASVSGGELDALAQALHAHQADLDAASDGKFEQWLGWFTHYVVAWLNDRNKIPENFRTQMPAQLRALTVPGVEADLRRPRAGGMGERTAVTQDLAQQLMLASRHSGLEEIPQPTADELAAWLQQLTPVQEAAWRLYGPLVALPPAERGEIVETVAKAYRVYGKHFRRTARYLVRTRGRGTAETKADGSPVLPQDQQIQRRFNRLTNLAFPLASIIGEEGSVVKPHARWWMIRDPLDGTRNYQGRASVPYPSHYLSTLTMLYRLDDGRMIPVLTITVAPEYLDGQPLWLAAGLGIDGVLINGRPVQSTANRPLSELIAGVTHIPQSELVNRWYVPAMREHARGVVEYPDTMAMWEIPLGLSDPKLPGTLAIRVAPVWDTFPTWHLTEALGGAVLELASGRRFQPTLALLAPGQTATTPALVYAVSHQAARDIVALRPAGLEEPTEPGDPTLRQGSGQAVPMPDPSTTTAAGVADYLTRRWGIPVRQEGSRYVVDQWTIPPASWTMPAMHDPVPGRIIEDVAAMPVQVPTYRFGVLPTFSVPPTSARGAYLGFIKGVDHPVVIKITSESGRWWPGDVDEVVNVQLFGRQGILPEVYGVIQDAEGHRGYVMQIVPGRSPRSENVAAVLAHPDVQAMRRRAGEAGLGLPSIVKTVIDRYAGMDAGNAKTFDEDQRAAWIIAQNAGWAIHELSVAEIKPTSQAYLLSNEAVLAALVLLKALDGTPLPVIAVVDPARRERLRAIAKHGGFSDAAITVWEQRYLVIAASNDRAGMQAAMLNAIARLAARLGRPDIQPIPVYDLPKAPGAFRDELLKLLSEFGLTIEPETLPDEAIQDLYRAAQA